MRFIFIILIILVICGLIVGALLYNGNVKKNCFKEIAKENCNNLNTYLNRLSLVSNPIPGFPTDGYSYECDKAIIRFTNAEVMECLG